jgi:hypothetical protein
MRMKKIKNSDDAVAGIVVTVLLIGLIMAVMVMVKTVYVPQWIEESEAAHMEEVSNQFAMLKYALDIQSIVNQSTAISATITLGNKEIPFFDLGRTFDSLGIIEDGCNITVKNNTVSSSYSTDAIKYSSRNLHFVDQSYVYEAGSLILSQDPSSILHGKPSFFVTEFGKNLSFTFVNISGIAGRTSVSGYGNYPIYLEVANPNNQYTEINNVTDITIVTNYADAWYIALNSSLLQSISGFEYEGNGVGKVGYNITSASDRVTLEFIDSSGDYVNLFIREVNISAQIAFGLV